MSDTTAQVTDSTVDTTGATAGEATGEPNTDQQAKPKPTETVDFWKDKAREQERRAKANAEKATLYDQQQEANKTELQKATDAATAAETRAATAETANLRLRIALKHGISDEDSELFLTGTDEDTLTKQAERLAGRVADQAKKGNHARGLGNNPTPAENDELKTVRELFGGQS